MKALLLSFLFVFVFCSTANTQWVQKHSGTMVNMSDAVSDQIFWAGRWDATAGTFVTTDGGQTWTSSTFVDPKGAPVYCIDALNADTAYVVTSEIFKTTNRGYTWVQQITTFSTGFANCIHFFDANNGVATGDPNGGYFEIYTTTNGGDNWVRVPSSNIPASLPNETGIVSSFAAYNNTFWFATSGAASEQRIIRSTDKGYTWTLLTSFPIPLLATPTIEFRDSQHGIFIGNGYLIFRTSNGGVSWTTDSLASWIEFMGSPSYVPGTLSTYVANVIGLSGEEELYISLVSTDDGATWKRMDSWQSSTFNAPSAQEWTSPNAGWTCLVEKGIYKWPGYTGKHIWRAGSSVKYGTTSAGEVGDTFAISIGNYGTLPTTINGLNLSSTNFSLVNSPSLPITLQPWDAVEVSISFTPQTRGLLNDSLIILSDAANYSSLSVNLSGKALAFTPPLSDVIYAASDSLYSIDFSNFSPMLLGSFEGPEIDGMAVNPVDSVLIGISMGTSSSTLYKIDPILGGCVPLVTIPAGNIRAIAFAPSGTLFAAQKSGSLYKINLTSGEATLIGTASGVQYASIAFSPTDGRLFASVSRNVGTGKDMICVVDTSTADTTLIGITGDGKNTPAITFNIEDSTLYGLKGTQTEVNKLITINTTNGSGTEIALLGMSGLQSIFISSIIVGVEDEINYTPTSYELYQNYPNPFNPSTKISWQSPVGSQQTLKIYDILGNEVATLVDEYRSAGRYEVEFNASSLPSRSGSALTSGVYFYQLRAGEYVNTKKMILLK